MSNSKESRHLADETDTIIAAYYSKTGKALEGLLL
jgi:hypothetical protein